jgi:hypothetical protein
MLKLLRKASRSQSSKGKQGQKPLSIPYLSDSSPNCARQSESYRKMAKRLTDADKWKKPFIRSLPVEYKLFWLYILDDCDHAGIWQVDTAVAELRLGIKLSLQKAQGFFEEKIVVFDDQTKWFIPDFIRFQYGEFNEANKMYKSIIPVLKRHSLIPHLSSIYPPKVMVMVKDTVLGNKGEAKIENSDRQDFLTNMIWKEQFCMTKGVSMADLDSIQRAWLKDVDLKDEYVDSYKRYFTNYFNKKRPTASSVDKDSMSDYQRKLNNAL